ncbi:hypothetical protein NDR87_13860 [Nocardia sp. CDC159]|uniref:Uncharacterized protein n=1 Tax=Nocardia pulmonis TaxID=2951408 RepID=A0A9X2E553_9NOCA|nr:MULTISPECIES: hypothetical protein [Nocardia]MCM6774492.1 hypothetical protein [Nocardia pulmonis]MCM6787442.1 hypothetical protein [Nocardia sp. CDC159]
MESATATIAQIVHAITPLDALEHQHIDQTLAWLARTDDLPARQTRHPSPHLVASVALADPDQCGIYVGLHRNSGLHLPMGRTRRIRRTPPRRDTTRSRRRTRLGITTTGWPKGRTEKGARGSTTGD